MSPSRTAIQMAMAGSVPAPPEHAYVDGLRLSILVASLHLILHHCSSTAFVR